MTASVTVRHNFETGHRLPILRGKCQNLHGHSWWAEVTVEAPNVAAGTVVEFGQLKSELREWIDTELDHGLMLGKDDPLVPALSQAGKVFVFDHAADGPTNGLAWPTVENVARLLYRVADSIVVRLPKAPDAAVAGVSVQETHVNGARWSP